MRASKTCGESAEGPGSRSRTIERSAGAMLETPSWGFCRIRSITELTCSEDSGLYEDSRA